MNVCFHSSKYSCSNTNNGHLILVYGIENKGKIIDMYNRLGNDR